MQRHVVEMVQVPEEPEDELYTFLMEHRECICSLIQADRSGWDDRSFPTSREWICSKIQADRSDCDDPLFSTSRRVLELPRLGVEDGGVPEPVHQHFQDGGFPNSVPQDPQDEDKQDNQAKH